MIFLYGKYYALVTGIDQNGFLTGISFDNHYVNFEYVTNTDGSLGLGFLLVAPE